MVGTGLNGSMVRRVMDLLQEKMAQMFLLIFSDKCRGLQITSRRPESIL